jgi:hypothetical protein
MSNILSAGTSAPEPTLHVTPDQTLPLKELQLSERRLNFLLTNSHQFVVAYR